MRCGCEACEPGQRAADDGQELRAEHVPDAGQAGDDRGVMVGPKDAGYLTIKVGELAVEVEHGLGESRDEGSGGCLAGNVSGCRLAASTAAWASRPAPWTPRRFS